MGPLQSQVWHTGAKMEAMVIDNFMEKIGVFQLGPPFLEIMDHGLNWKHPFSP